MNENGHDRLIEQALAEDTGQGDVTSEILIPPDLEARGSLLVKERGVLAGIEIAARVFHRVDSSIQVSILVRDGAEISPGDIPATVSGKLTGILKAERTALNFLQRLSGIATLTSRFVAEASGYHAVISDTRKTTPGLRQLEKYAVLMGGGRNHRMHMGDGILIKDNHLAALRRAGLSLEEIVRKAKAAAPPGMTVEVEVTSTGEAVQAVAAGADIVMLDNMPVSEMAVAVKSISGRAKVEASGGITLENVREVAASGVDIISVGALTHSPRALDISLELEL